MVSALLDSDWTQNSIRFDRMYDDYPKSAQNNASKALVYRENPKAKMICSDYIWSICEKFVNGQKFTMEELGKVASFIRYKDQGEKNYEDNPSRIAWDAMGGTNGIIWAKRKWDSAKKRAMSITPKHLCEAEDMSNEYCNSCLMNQKGWCQQHNMPTIGNKVCNDWQDSAEKTQPLFTTKSRNRKHTSLTLNRLACRKAKALKLDGDSDNSRNYIQENGWDEYSKWFLGIDKKHTSKSKSRYKYPITTNFNGICEKALKKAKRMAVINNDKEIFKECDILLKHIISVTETENSVIIEYGMSDNYMGGRPEDERGGRDDERGGRPEDERGRSEEERASIREELGRDDERGAGRNEERSFKSYHLTGRPTFKIIRDENGLITDYQDVKIAGYASTNEDTTSADRGGDYLRVGAFNNTIGNFMKNPVMLMDHGNSTKQIVGKWTHLAEDERGLYVEGVLSNSKSSHDCRFLVAEGNLSTLSIGGIFDYGEDGKAINEVDLMEISLVAIPMNPDARFIVKSAEEEKNSSQVSESTESSLKKN